jgi:two-component system NarL family response regulator
VTTLLAEILEGRELTEREIDVLCHMAEGLTASETGERMFLAVETVKGYRKRVIAKIGARNGTHAVTLAFRRCMLS